MKCTLPQKMRGILTMQCIPVNHTGLLAFKVDEVLPRANSQRLLKEVKKEGVFIIQIILFPSFPSRP